jgi:hypothetical protein
MNTSALFIRVLIFTAVLVYIAYLGFQLAHMFAHWF